jgi:hypothetical protein
VLLLESAPSVHGGVGLSPGILMLILGGSAYTKVLELKMLIAIKETIEATSFICVFFIFINLIIIPFLVEKINCM